jgi:hypothetical protein
MLMRQTDLGRLALHIAVTMNEIALRLRRLLPSDLMTVQFNMDGALLTKDVRWLC